MAVSSHVDDAWVIVAGSLHSKSSQVFSGERQHVIFSILTE